MAFCSLNAYEPVVAVALMESQALFFKSLPLFRKNCIDGITANEKVLKALHGNNGRYCNSTQSCSRL
jgi:aspartate ammonia-lyase